MSNGPNLNPNTMDMTDENSHPLLLTTERIVTVYPQMTDAEKSDLSSWEKTHVTGDGKFASSDWPGWKSVFQRLAH